MLVTPPIRTKLGRKKVRGITMGVNRLELVIHMHFSFLKSILAIFNDKALGINDLSFLQGETIKVGANSIKIRNGAYFPPTPPPFIED